MKSIVKLLALLTVTQIATPAFSDNLNLHEYCLQPTQWYHHRPQIQILNTGPIVEDLRTPEEHTVYNINVPPAPQGVTRQVNVNVPNLAASGPEGTPLGKAGFTSNISPSSGPARNLPPGQKTGSMPPVGSLIADKAALKTKAQPILKAHSEPVQQTPTLSYKSEPYSAASGNSAKTSLIGKLLK